MTRVVFIFGCQRSGSRVLLDFLAQAGPALRVFPERDSPLTDKTPPEGSATVRLNPLDDVERVLAGVQQDICVVKSLVESQRAGALLDRFPGSVGFWPFRHYREVAASMIHEWGERVGAPLLLQVLDTSAAGNWRHEGVPDDVRAEVAEHYSPDMRIQDAAALFWWVRNTLLFRQGLERDERVMLLDYAGMCSDPGYVDRALDRFGIPHPPAESFFSGASLGKGHEMTLTPLVEGLCDDLLQDLLQHRFA